MTKLDRIRAAVASEPVDRVPFSFWYHFTDLRGKPLIGKALAKAELEFYHTYDPDFLKVMHDIPFDLPEGTEKIESLAQWKSLPIIDPERGNFGQQLATIRMILEAVGDEVPVVDTVFNCFAYAEMITERRTMEFYRQDPAAFHQGMSRMAESLARWGQAIVEQGGAGIYLAVQGPTANVMSEEEYRHEFLRYDEQVLAPVRDSGTLNVVHLHGEGEKLHWRVWDSLPSHALSWSSRISPPSIAEARRDYRGCIVAGVNEMKIGSYASQQVRQEIREAIEATDGLGLIVAAGCAVPTDCPPANLHAFKETVTGA